MLDACHSGGLDTRTRGDRGVKVVARSFAEQIEGAREVEGRAVLSSCSKDEVSYEDSKLKHGVFTHYVLQGLKKRRADENKDGMVTTYELGYYVRKAVKNWCKQERKIPSQTPRILINDTSGEIVLSATPKSK